ncbi:MAG: ABC transporter permease [Alphaproteobacteria bacterium]|nr:ABC transporter permease [Alphaproteobacteria bacterium]
MSGHVSHLRRLWLYGFGALALVYLLLPTLIVVPMSFSDTRYLTFPPRGFSLRWYEAYFSSLEWREATYISFLAAVLTAVIATAMGTACAYALAAARLPCPGIVRMLTAAPMIVPAVLIGIGSFFLFAHLGIAKTLTGVVAAHVVLALPLVVITVSAGLRSYDMRQELVARSLGANRIVAFATVTLPQLKLSIASAALFAFITSLDEAVVSLFVGGGDAPTLPRRMFNALRDEIDPTIAAVSTCLLLVSLILVIATQCLGRGERRD